MSKNRFAKFFCACIVALTVAMPIFTRAAEDADDSLSALTELLASTDDAQFQLDVLKGMSDGLKGRRNDFCSW